MKASLENRFTYHPPVDDAQIKAFEAIRGLAYNYANFLVQTVPESDELERAIERLEEVVFWANAGLARS